MFALSIKSLIIGRILIGCVSLWAVVERYWVFLNFYKFSPKGFLSEPTFTISDLALISGYPPALHFFYILLVATTIALILGWRTRMALSILFLSWATFRFVDIRLFDRGDHFLGLLYLYVFFLPMEKKSDLPYAKNWQSPLNMTFFVQVSVVYVCAFFFKSGSSWIKEFTALEIVLKGNIYSGWLSSFLLQYPELTKILTIITLALELFVPIILLLNEVKFRSYKVRQILCVMMISFHLAIFLTMTIHHFAIVMMIPWILLYPTNSEIFGERQTFRFFFLNYRRESILTGVFLLLILGGNVGRAMESNRLPKEPSIIKDLMNFSGFWQKWNMFSPDPKTRRWNFWKKVFVTNENGAPIEIFSNESELKQKIWGRIHVWARERASFEARYMDYLCSLLSPQIQQKKIIKVVDYKQLYEQPAVGSGTETAEKEWSCDTPFAKVSGPVLM